MGVRRPLQGGKGGWCGERGNRGTGVKGGENRRRRKGGEEEKGENKNKRRRRNVEIDDRQSKYRAIFLWRQKAEI